MMRSKQLLLGTSLGIFFQAITLCLMFLAHLKVEGFVRLGDAAWWLGLMPIFLVKAFFHLHKQESREVLMALSSITYFFIGFIPGVAAAQFSHQPLRLIATFAIGLVVCVAALFALLFIIFYGSQFES